MAANHISGVGFNFDTTQWSLIVAAIDSKSPNFDQAMERLCQSYWSPLYAFLRRKGHTSVDAADLTQGFFAHLIAKRIHGKADPERGRFRSFLLASFKRYLSTTTKRAEAAKRGGSVSHISIDLNDAEGGYGTDLSEAPCPEGAFDRRWASLVFERVVATIRREYQQEGLLDRYDALCHCMMYPESALNYRELAPALGLSEDGVKSAARRLRKRFRERFREAIARTVTNPADVDNEVRVLIAALGTPQG